MATASIRAVLFDIGGVILRVNVGRTVESLAAGASRSAAQIREGIEGDPRFRDFQEGRMSPTEWHRHLVASLGLRYDFDQFRDLWNRALEPDLLLDEALFARLGQRARLALLSNTDLMHVAHVEAAFTFSRHFPIRIYSCTEGASKPSARIYQAAIAALGVAAEEILYIDDVPAYVEAGHSAGMRVHHFRDAVHLVDELRGHGLLP